MEEKEKEEDRTTSTNDLKLINSMNKEQLVKYLKENLGEELDEIDLLSNEQVEEYKQLLIEALRNGDYSMNSAKNGVEDTEPNLPEKNKSQGVEYSHSNNNSAQDSIRMTTLKEQKELRNGENNISGKSSGVPFSNNNNNDVGTKPPQKEIPVITLDSDDDDVSPPPINNSNVITISHYSPRKKSEMNIDAFSISDISSLPKDIFDGVQEYRADREDESIGEKMRRWDEMNSKDESPPIVTDIPENDEKLDNSLPFYDDDAEEDEEVVDITCETQVKNLNDKEVSLNPDLAEEYCGAGLLSAKIRMTLWGAQTCSGLSEVTSADLEPMFYVPLGYGYDTHSLKVTCKLCNCVMDKRNLAPHVKSIIHRMNLVYLSLKFTSQTKTKPSVPSVKTSKESSSNRENSGNQNKVKLDTEVENNDDEPPSSAPKKSKLGGRARDRRERSLSRNHTHRDRRSRSKRKSHSSSSSNDHHPRSRTNSKSSPPPTSSSARNGKISLQEKFDAFLAKNGKRRSPLSTQQNGDRNWMMGPSTKLDETKIFEQKLMLLAHGKWSAELEERWKLMEEERKEVKNRFIEVRGQMIDQLQQHAVYKAEWVKFWEHRYEQLAVKEGKGVTYADNYDYTKEWEVAWQNITKGILQKKYHQKIVTIRQKHKLDFESIVALNAQSPVIPPSNNNTAANNTSSIPSTKPEVTTTTTTILPPKFINTFTSAPPPAPVFSSNGPVPFYLHVDPTEKYDPVLKFPDTSD